MEGTGNHERIERIAGALTSQGMLKQKVETDVAKYNRRREALLEPVGS